MHPSTTSLALMLVLTMACIPTSKTDTGTTCDFITNGDAEQGDLTGWTSSTETAVAAVESQDQSDGTVTPYGGDWFFSFALDKTATAEMTHSCSPAPDAATCTLSGVVQTEGMGEPPDHGIATLRFVDSGGTTLAEQSTDPLSTESLAWQPFEVQLDVPEDALKLQIILAGTLAYGDYVNVFWDDLELSCEDGVSSAS